MTVACVNDATKDQPNINNALKKLKSGDTLLLTGTCKANVSGIPGGVTVDGGGDGSCGEVSGATIEAADATRSTVSHGSSGNVTIKGLIIKGSVNGVSVAGVGEGTIRENNVTGNTGSGINVNRESHARIINNCIENNGAGISVNDNSSARIGFLSTFDPAASPVKVKDNDGNGISVRRSSDARILCNDISNNAGIGVSVDRVAHADVAGNTINGNGSHGIRARESSGVNLGNQTFNSCATDFTDEANETTVANGTGAGATDFGIRCEIQGYVRGKRGTLTGLNGATLIDDGCLDKTVP